MCFWSAMRDDVPEWQALAHARGLAITVTETPTPGLSREDRWVNVFVGRPEEMWRVPAVLALRETAFVDGVWSDAAENQMSYLLGYTTKQRAAWLAARRRDRPAWTCATVYTLLDSSGLALVESVSRRCLGSAALIAGTDVFFHGYPIKPRALSLVPKGHTLARFGLRWSAFEELFWSLRKPKRGLTSRTLTAKSAATLQAGMTSNVQLLSSRGWDSSSV